MDADVIVVGAGVAGLACGRILSRAGRRVILVERSNGVGGRCATRRVLDGQAVDHGVAFLHGNDRSFLAAIDEVAAPKREGWPYRVEGRGVPCQPDVYTARDRRIAFVDGVSVFAKHLAHGLDVRKGTTVVRVAPQRVTLADGTSLTAPDIVLTPPIEQLGPLLPELPELRPARTILGWLATVPCLTVIAAYERSVAEVHFDVRYPDEGPIQAVIHDSSKREHPAHCVLVLQAGVRASEAWLALEPEQWKARLLEAAAKELGPWARSPHWAVAHRWRYARFSAGVGLGGLLRVSLREGGTLAIAGEALGPLSGVQGAFISGERLARRMCGESD